MGIVDCGRQSADSFVSERWHVACSCTRHDTRRTQGSNEEVCRGCNFDSAKAIPKDHINDEIAAQLADAATSTAAHYRAVCRAKSRADFINKLSGAVEEVDESALWLEILEEAKICTGTHTKPLWKEADELTRIFVRSRETARARQKRERQRQAPAKRPAARRR
jgi:four helix bundle protein